MSESLAPFTSYRPSAFYFRSALRRAASKAEAAAVGLQVVRELEMLKEWVREQGLIPPRRFVLLQEAQDKGLTPIAVFPSAAEQAAAGPRLPA